MTAAYLVLIGVIVSAGEIFTSIERFFYSVPYCLNGKSHIVKFWLHSVYNLWKKQNSMPRDTNDSRTGEIYV